MPNQWDPGIRYHGDEYIARTGAVISEDLQKALAKYDEERKANAAADGLFETLQGDPTLKSYVPVDALQRWGSLHPDKKAGIILGIGRRAAEDAQKRAEQFKAADDARANEELAQRLQIAQMEDKTRRDIATMKDPANSEPTAIDPYVDPVTNAKVPGVGIVRKTGGVVYTGGMSGGINIEKDPQTGAFFYRDPKGVPHPVTMPAITGGAAATALNPNGATATPPGSGNSAGKVKVKTKDGKVGFIPAGQLQDALSQGYTLAQ